MLMKFMIVGNDRPYVDPPTGVGRQECVAESQEPNVQVTELRQDHSPTERLVLFFASGHMPREQGVYGIMPVCSYIVV